MTVTSFQFVLRREGVLQQLKLSYNKIRVLKNIEDIKNIQQLIIGKWVELRFIIGIQYNLYPIRSSLSCAELPLIISSSYN